MKNTNTIVILAVISMGFIRAQDVILKTCSRERLLDCPSNSLCTQILNDIDDPLKCICIEGFQLNPNWLNYEQLNSSSVVLNEHYCLSPNLTLSSGENKLLVYIRSPARKEHLAYGILMVLLAAALATVVLYGISVLKPLKRTKSMYQKLKYKRRNITPLQEMDELELNRRYEMQTL